MDFYASTADLQRAFKLLSVTAKLNTNEFEGRIIITTEEGSVKFLSHNGKTGLVHTIPAKVSSTGSISVVYSKIRSFIMTLRPWSDNCGVNEVHFFEKENRLDVVAIAKLMDGSTSKSQLKLDLNLSPHLLSISPMEEPDLVLNSSIIKTAIDKTIYAVNPSSGRHYGRGICMFFTEEDLVFVAVDGISVCEFSVKNEFPVKSGSYLLPYEFLTALRRLIVDDLQLFIKFSDRGIKILFDNTLFEGVVHKIVMGKDYPTYQVCFDSLEKSIQISRDLILNGLDSFRDVFNTEDSNRLSFRVADGKISMSTDNALFEYVNDDFDSSMNVVVDINGIIMLDTLKAITDENVRINFRDDKRGLMFTSIGFDKQRAYINNIARR